MKTVMAVLVALGLGYLLGQMTLDPPPLEPTLGVDLERGKVGPSPEASVEKVEQLTHQLKKMKKRNQELERMIQEAPPPPQVQGKVVAEEEVVVEESEDLPPRPSLLVSLEKLRQLDDGRRHKRLAKRMVDQHPDIPEDRREEVKEVLVVYHQERSRLAMSVYDPSVDLHDLKLQMENHRQKTLDSLGQELTFDLAENLLQEPPRGKKGHGRDITWSFQKMSLDESQLQTVKQEAERMVGERPELGFHFHGRGQADIISSETPIEVLQARRDFAAGSDSLAELVQKSQEAKRDAQLEMLENLSGSLAFDEDEEAKVKGHIDRQFDHGQRSIQFLEAVENDPEVLQGFMKLRQRMRDKE